MLDDKDKKTLFERIDKADDRELAGIFKIGAGVDPFELPELKLMLPSAVREEIRKQIKEMINNGTLTPKPIE